MLIKSIIVEDNPNYSEDLKVLIRETQEPINILSICSNVQAAVKSINKLKPDLVFMDIMMNENPKAGFEVLDKVNEIDFDVIFTTSYLDKNLQEIRRCGLHFIAKPYLITDLKEAILRFKHKIKGDSKLGGLRALKSNLNETERGNRVVSVKSGEYIFFPKVKDIICFTSEDPKTTCCWDSGDGTIRKEENTKRIGEWEAELAPDNFFRCNSRTLVNLVHVKSFNIFLEVINVTGLPNSFSVSRDKIKELKYLMENLTKQLR